VAKKYFWTKEETDRLRNLWESGVRDSRVLAEKIGRPSSAVEKKLKRMGLVVVGARCAKTTTTIKLPEELPTVEEALKILAGALRAAAEPELDRVEVQRLQAVATLARTYKELFADYIDYRLIEIKLVELEAKYAEIAQKIKGDGKKAKSLSEKRDTA